MGFDQYHEPPDELPAATRTFARLCASLTEEAEALTQKIRAVLEPEGNWVQYSYHLGKKQVRGAASFRLRASKIVWLNFPPARVSVFQK